jgi:hypothetical protein
VRDGDGGDSGLPHVVSVIRSKFCDEFCVVSGGLVNLPRTLLFGKPAPVEDVWLGNSDMCCSAAATRETTVFCLCEQAFWGRTTGSRWRCDYITLLFRQMVVVADREMAVGQGRLALEQEWSKRRYNFTPDCKLSSFVLPQIHKARSEDYHID